MTDPQAQPIEQPETPAPASKLTRKRQRFVQEYLVDLNGADAARRAGYSARGAKQIGHKLLKDAAVRAAIDRELAARRAEYPALHQRTVDQLSNLVFADPRTLFDEEGRPKPIHELTQAQAAAIAGIEVEEKINGDETVRLTKIRLVAKTPAAELLMKVTGGISSGPSALVQVNINQPIPDDPQAASAAYARIINGGG